MCWTPAYVAIGSNLHDPERQVRLAFAHLDQLPQTRLIARSHAYRTRPLGPQNQPDFVNAAAGLLTQLDPPTLLARLQQIEKDMGRQPPAERWGARLIDLDLLMVGDLVRDSAPLLPHPGVHERNFVLYPLADIAPHLHVPGRGAVAELARRAGADGLQRL